MAENAPRSIAPQGIIDELKAKYETAPAGILKNTPLAVAKFTSLIWNRYYPFIPLETFDRLKDLHHRVIVTDNTNFDLLTKDWPERSSATADGVFTFDGNYIVIKNPQSMEYVWDKFLPQEKSAWIEKLGSEEKAKDRGGVERFGKVLLHETAHGFHRNDIDMPLGFVEHGVNYYARSIGKELEIVEFGLFEQWEADLYEIFLKRYGERVHRVFFGSEPSQERIWALMKGYETIK